MGSIAATTFIQHIRTNLGESLATADLLDPNGGSSWTNSEILEALNKAKDDAWDLIREVREDYFQVTGATVALVAATKEYNLASAFRQLKGLKITTSGYEDVQLRRMEQDTVEFQSTDALPASAGSGDRALIYCIIETGGTSKIKFANFPPAAITLSYDYIKYLDDMTLSGSSIIDIHDEIRRYIEANATVELLRKTPGDKRFGGWESRTKNYEGKVKKSVSKTEIRESTYVAPYNPW